MALQLGYLNPVRNTRQCAVVAVYVPSNVSASVKTMWVSVCSSFSTWEVFSVCSRSLSTEVKASGCQRSAEGVAPNSTSASHCLAYVLCKECDAPQAETEEWSGKVCSLYLVQVRSMVLMGLGTPSLCLPLI